MNSDKKAASPNRSTMISTEARKKAGLPLTISVWETWVVSVLLICDMAVIFARGWDDAFSLLVGIGEQDPRI